MEWGIDSSKIGVMRFSAGGHLAATISTHQEYGVCPEFQVLFYPVITMDKSYTDISAHGIDS
nr:alpha/beta hydrolase fold domain-containing protein [Bacteroides sp. CG01]